MNSQKHQSSISTSKMGRFDDVFGFLLYFPPIKKQILYVMNWQPITIKTPADSSYFTISLPFSSEWSIREAWVVKKSMSYLTIKKNSLFFKADFSLFWPVVCLAALWNISRPALRHHWLLSVTALLAEQHIVTQSWSGLYKVKTMFFCLATVKCRCAPGKRVQLCHFFIYNYSR